MKLTDRIAKIEAIIPPGTYEPGAWRIHNYGDGTFSIASNRLGIHRFNSQDEMESFIAEHHKGTAPGEIGFIHVNFIKPTGEKPAEL